MTHEIKHAMPTHHIARFDKPDSHSYHPTEHHAVRQHLPEATHHMSDHDRLIHLPDIDHSTELRYGYDRYDPRTPYTPHEVDQHRYYTTHVTPSTHEEYAYNLHGAFADLDDE